MKFNFIDKNILVTGSNSGSGLAIANAFSYLGANVIRIDKKFSSKVKSVDIRFDLSDYKKIPQLIAKIKKITKKIDILVNNAGISEKSLDPYKDFKTYHKTFLLTYILRFILFPLLIK